jgi:hypothetical protein
MGQIDPELPFQIGAMNGREAPKSGHRLNVSNAPRAAVPNAKLERALTFGPREAAKDNRPTGATRAR